MLDISSKEGPVDKIPKKNYFFEIGMWFFEETYTVVRLKSGLACVRVFGESPDF